MGHNTEGEEWGGPVPQDLLEIFYEVRNKISKKCTAPVRRETKY